MTRAEDEVPPTLPNGEQAYYLVSPSQLNTWYECKRKWGFQYILKIRPPSGKGAALGSVLHEDQLEPYLKDGRPLDFSQFVHGVYPAEIAATGLQYLPAPQSPGLKVEGYFKFKVASSPDIYFRGFKDYSVEPQYREDGLPHVGDHKSCGNWAYAKSADDLAGDPQAIIYAAHALEQYPDAPAVSLQWTYYGTKKKYRAHPVKAVLTREHVTATIAEAVLGAKELVSTLRSKKHPLELPIPEDTGTCEKYGGCPFKGNCNLSPAQRRPFAMSNTTSTASLIDRIKARNAAAGGVLPETAPAPAAPVLGVAARIAAAKAAKEAQPVMGVPSDQVPAPTEIPAVFANPAPAAAAASTLPVSDQPINCPTDFQPPPAPAATAPTTPTIVPAGPAAEQTKSKRPRRTKLEMEAARAAAEGATLTMAQELPATPETAAAQAKLMEATFAATSPEADANTPNEDLARVANFPSSLSDEVIILAGMGTSADAYGNHRLDPTEPPHGPTTYGMTLYLDCMPRGYKGTEAEHLIHTAKTEINAAHDVGDYRFVEYGKGTGMLSARVSELAASSSELYLDTTTPEGTACKAALVTMAARVIQATR